jgi:hypothetical protein
MYATKHALKPLSGRVFGELHIGSIGLKHSRRIRGRHRQFGHR